MTENSKTISLLVAAAAVLLLAFVTRERPSASGTESIVGKPLFPDLTDPLKVARMSIVSFDEDTSRTRKFEVAQINDSWSLPSHKNYPADGKDQVAAAVAALVDVKYLRAPESTNASDHELFGVVEPKDDEDQFGRTGVGKKVELRDASNKILARVIVGKEDKSPRAVDDFSSPQTQLRFVRIPGQDAVHRVALRTDKFSTKFDDWIETDLLKLSPWDITEIKLRDYSIVDVQTPSGEIGKGISPRADMQLAFDDKTSKWTLKELVEYKGRAKQDVKLGEDEELDVTKLNDLKNALSTLKIIDVARKPAQMGANLKAGKEYLDDAADLDLRRRGFIAQPNGDQVEIFSNDGEVTVRMKDGVEYVLRFGAVAGIDMTTEDEKKDKPEPADKADAAADADKKKDQSSGLSRYIMVMAQFNPDLLAKPELEPLPELKKAPEKPTAPAADDTAKAKSSDAKSTDAKAKGAKAPADTKAKGAAKSTDAKAADAKDAKKGNEKSDAKAADAKAVEPKSDEQPTAEELEALDAQREKIEKENRRKEDDYKEKLKKGEQHAKDLNARFADWYYVVNDQTYRKIHLGKDEIVKKKAAKDEKPAAGTAAPGSPINFNGLPGFGGGN